MKELILLSATPDGVYVEQMTEEELQERLNDGLNPKLFVNSIKEFDAEYESFLLIRGDIVKLKPVEVVSKWELSE